MVGFVQAPVSRIMAPMPAFDSAARSARSATARSRRAMALLCAVALWSACDVGTLDGGGGCVRIHQGDYELPSQAIVTRGLSARVTQAGTDLLTARVRELVLTFFDADEEGRAIVPLSDFGVGTLGLSLGPLSAELRDLVIALDLDGLDVSFVAGSSPARLRIHLDAADVSLVSGTLAGALDVLFIKPDLACGLGDGPSGRIARLGFDVDLVLATDASGALSVHTEALTVRVEEVGLTVVTDCQLAECQDGCGECQLACGAGDLAAKLAPAIQSLFADLIDTLVSWVADTLAPILIDAFLNGKPLAVEGTLDVASLGAALLPWLSGASPIGVLGQPAGDAFAVTGSGADTGLSVALDAGVDALSVAACIAEPSPLPLFVAQPPPPWPDRATGPDGSQVPYHMGLAISAAVVAEAVHASWRAGVLCIDLQSADLAALTGGAVVLTADALGVLLPGITSIVEPDAPVRVRLRPRLGDASPVRFAALPGEPDLTVTLDDAEIAVEAQVGDHFLRLVSFSADLALRLGLDALAGAQLSVRVDGIDVSDLRVPQSEIFASARLDLVAPFVVDLVLGVLAERALRFDLDLGSLVSSLVDLPLVPVIEEITGTGDWLRVLIGLRSASPPMTALLASRVHLIEARPGGARLWVEAPAGAQVQLRAAGGAWGAWHAADHPFDASLAGLWRRGPTFIEARLRPAGGRPGPAARVPVTLAAPEPAAVPSTATVPLAPRSAETAPLAPRSAESAPLTGCRGGPAGAPPLSPLVALALLLLAARRQRRVPTGRRAAAALGLTLLLAPLPACGSGEAPPLSCTADSQCPARSVCGPEGTCVVATACASDDACCPGSLCFNGYCRPTPRCSEQSPCLAPGTACEDARCVAAPCDSDAACPDSARCTGGRCVAGLPCGGCPAGAACDLPSGRCVAAPLCDGACDPGDVLTLDPASPVTPLSCGGLSARCRCTPLPELPPPLPGIEGQFLATPGGPTLVSHDPVYGDLVVSRFSEDLDSRSDLAVDGVPDLAATAASVGYRGGIAEAGPRRGLHPAAIWRTESGHAIADLIHQDGDLARARYARVDLNAGQLLQSHELPVEGKAGRYACLARHPATGRLVGWVYVARDASGTVSRLVRVEARTDTPAGPEDWSVALVRESPLPVTSPEPCAAACALTELCVRFGPGDDRCVGALERPSCAAPCAARELCVDAPTPVCRPRVQPEGAPGALPTGEGLFVTCAAVPDGLVVAWYDADAGALRALRGLGAGAVAVRVDGTDDPHDASDVGAHARLAVAPDGTVRIAYQDARAGSLWLATQATPEAPWETERVHAAGAGGAGRDLGAWPALVHDAAGEPVVAYADTERGDIWVARRGPDGCWRRTRPLADGAFAWPALALAPDGSLQLSALLLAFDEAGRPLHRLLTSSLPIPAGPCAAP
ncbi:MAG: hypothetical protein H6744_15290 [Deltaproteobacteria bacterium]|nr:hypothetical protein [Deltaproteobacteria bacterium]